MEWLKPSAGAESEAHARCPNLSHATSQSWQRPSVEQKRASPQAGAGEASWLQPSPSKSSTGMRRKAVHIKEDTCQPSWLHPSPSASECKAARTSEAAAGKKHKTVSMSEYTCQPSWLQPSPSSSECDTAHTSEVSTGTKHKKACISKDACQPCQPSWLYPNPGSSSTATSVPASSSSNKVPDVHLSLAAIMMCCHWMAGDKLKPLDVFGCNATDPALIKAALAKPTCKCKCGANIPLDAMTTFLLNFNQMDQEEKTAFLHYSRDGLSTEPPNKVRWHLLGHYVCVARLCQLLHTSARTWYKLLRGIPDGRVAHCQMLNHSQQESTLSADQFFMEMYLSAAETLAEEPGVVKVDETINEDAYESEDRSSGYCPPCKANVTSLPGWDPTGDFQEQIRSLGAQGSLNWTPRYVQHQRLMDFWWQYLAWHSLNITSQRPASMSTLFRRWHHKWKHVLRLRKSSQHSQCSECSRYSNFLHFTSSPTEKRQAAQNWHMHLKEQMHDRLIYWHSRWWSRRGGNVLTIIIDSMDKAKCAYPQYSFRCPKSFDGFIRPKLVITCAIAHGYCTDFYIAEDEEMFHGASAFCEVLTRTIERVHKICKREGKPFPEHLWIQSDNTTAQAKNSEVATFLALLVMLCHFKTASLNFLVVGHTHEDVDQMFGILFALVLRRIRFQRPAELQEAISVAMQDVVAARGERLGSFLLTHTRDFKTWMQPLGIKPHNAFMTRDGQSAAHSFTYKFRMDLTPDELASLETETSAGIFAPHDWDVFCTVKKRMHSVSNNGIPVLVLPRERMSRLSSPGPAGSVYKKGALPERRRKALREFANCLEDYTRAWDFKFSYCRAAEDLRLLANGRDQEVAPAGWLESAGEARAHPLVTTSNNPYFGHLPDISWRLLVKFKD